MNWSAGSSGIIGRLGARWLHRRGIPAEHVATALYRGILGRDPDSPGLMQKAGVLRSGDTLEQVIRAFVQSPEFCSRFLQSLVPAVELPDLRAVMPERYEVQNVKNNPLTIFLAQDDSHFTQMAALIEKHRFYDRFGVWTPVIDLDKEITAAIVRGLGARSCFELGCFTGPVISLLADAGVSVLGADVSHTAFTFAYPNIRDAMKFGDLLSLDIDRVFDVVLCMDVLEHLNPLLLDVYIDKLTSLLDPDGCLYVNSPMWGSDRMFGVLEERYLREWDRVGDASYWRHLPCDGRGWPLHGHLIWASSVWWERKFAEHGLVRDTIVESTIQQVLARWFEQAPGRKCVFVLTRKGTRRSSGADAKQIVRMLSQLSNVHAILGHGEAVPSS